jgi:hypothetical protein
MDDFKNSHIYPKLLVLLIFSLINTVDGGFDPLDDELIEVWYLEAPLLKDKFGNLLSKFNLFHAGFGFIQNGKNLDHYEATIDYSATYSVLDAIFPTLVRNQTGAVVDLIWKNQGQVNMNERIDYQYWTQQTKMFQITGRIYKEFLCWIPNYNKEFSAYELFEVTNPYSRAILLSSTNCEDFVWEAFKMFYDLGGTVYGSIYEPPSRDSISLFSQTVTPVDYQSNKQDILNFYTSWQFDPSMVNMTAQELILQIEKWFKGSFYYYFRGVYYKLLLEHPYCVFTYNPTQYTGPDRNPETYQSCIIKPSISPAAVVCIALVVLIASYCLVGVLINSLIMKRTGVERIPNYQVWWSIFSLVQDGFRFTIIGFRSLFKPNQYDRLIQ